MAPPKKPVRSGKPRKNKRILGAKDNAEQLNMDNKFSNLCINRLSNETGLVFDERMIEHHCLFDPKYPECPERFSYSLQRCRDYNLVDRCTLIPSRPATREEILLQHSQELIDVVKSTKDCDDKEFLYQLSSKYDSTYFHPSTYDLSLLAAGCTIDLVTQVVEGKLKNGMGIVRPPGHHAMYDKTCGYCFFNNVAIAAKHAIDHLGVQRILIVDWDVHHGQATQYSFYDDPRVLYFSIHRYEHGSFWPNLRESNYDYTGEGKGLGFNINVPLNKVGMGNSEYLSIFHQILLPVANEFSPELVIVSAGYDAAIGCREGEMEVTPAGYAHFTSLLMSLASGKICVILEGGYCLKSLSESVGLTLRALLGDPCPTLGPTAEPDPSLVETILDVISVQRPFWKCLGFQGKFRKPELDEDHVKENNWPKHSPAIKYLGEPPPEVYPVTGFYPAQSEERIAELDKRIDQLIASTNLTVPHHRTCIVYDKKMILHRNYQEPGHPEKPERFNVILAGLQELKILERCRVLESRSATEDELALFHGQKFIGEMKQLKSMKSKEMVDLADKFHSVYFCKDTYNSAVLAAGCVLQVVDEVLSGKSQNGAAIVRPPGHHAEKDEACGFCIFNNVAIAAKYALSKYNLERILILDWDVHHGNGIQSAFADDPRVLYISIHRFNNSEFFPSSWAESNFTFVGEGKGEGYNVNVPWNSVGLGDADYLSAFHQVVLPMAYQYSPQLVLVAAGFDAAKGDFLGNCKVTPAGYSHMTHLLSGLANGRMILALEGGYNLASISASFAACIKVLLGDPCPPFTRGLRPSEKAIHAITNVLNMHKKYWTCLKYQVNLPEAPLTEESDTKELEGAVGGTISDNIGAAGENLADMFVTLQLTSDGPESDCQGPFAVVPKTDCPHLDSVKSLSDNAMLSTSDHCFNCHSTLENWVCLTCYKVFCSRYINAHMLSHYEINNTHCISLSLSDFSIWCYKCQSYVEHDIFLPIKEAAHLYKFSQTVPPSTHVQ